MAVAGALFDLVDQANAEFVHYAVGQNSPMPYYMQGGGAYAIGKVLELVGGGEVN